MTTYKRPGTYVDEVLLTETTPVNNTVAVACFVQSALRGPVVPTKLTSWQDATKHFGGFTGVPANDRLLQAIYDALNNGARTIYAMRVAGAGAVASRLAFNLEDASPPGDPALDVSAINPGTWGDNLYVEILDGSSADRFSLVVRYVPDGAAITNQQIVERWLDLSLNSLDSRYALGIINNGDGASAYIRVALHSAYVYTDSDVLASSTVAGGSALASGSDGSTVVTSTRVAALPSLDAITQPFVLNVPGETSATLITALLDYSDPNRTRQDTPEPGRGDVFVVIDSAPGADADAAVTLAATYPTSDFGAVYYPNLLVADPSVNVPGATKLVGPGAAVVGRFMATDAAKGVFKSPAGTVDGALRGVIGLDPAFVQRNAALDKLAEKNVNAIKVIPNLGPCIFGARTLNSSYVTRYISARRTIISARADIVNALSYVPFENNDSILWAGMSSAADKICRELFAAGGLKGTSEEQAYFVKCDSDNNTLASIQQGEVHLEVGLAVQRPAEFVVLTISQFNGGATVVESATDAA